MLKDNKRLVNYYRIRDIVQYIYVNYILQQVEKYGDKVNAEALAEESMLLIIDIMNNRPNLDEKEIATLAVKEAHIKREWHTED